MSRRPLRVRLRTVAGTLARQLVLELGELAAASHQADKLLTVDLASGHVLNKQPVAHDPDVLAIDPVANRLYVAAEPGTLSTYDVAVPNAPKSLGDVFVAEGAHTVAVDPVTHRLYFALANLNGRAALRVLEPENN